MRKTIILTFACLLTCGISAQQRIVIENYPEPRVGTTPDVQAWNTLADGLHASWASRDVHYELHNVPQLRATEDLTLTAWRGERVNAEAVLYSKTNQGELSVRLAPMMLGGRKCGEWGRARFLNYVIADDYKACGTHDMTLTPRLVPDVIEQDKPKMLPAMETRPVWCRIDVPREAKAGTYSTQLEVVNADGRVVKSLNVRLNVIDRVLPTPHDQTFHLDLWQQPYSVSRYYGLERWSHAHIEALRPYLMALGEAGQKVVSTIMFYEPWGDQSHDKFTPMIQSTRHADGSWSYDYSVFDKYVNLCAECGIDEQINCYSMVPWTMTFRYFDEAKQHDVDLHTTTASAEYKELWTHFLRAFRTHLEQKGWFDKTCIAMDERSEADMLNAYEIAHAAGFKMALAGNYHASLVDKLYDFCVALGQVPYFSESDRKVRDSRRQVTTFYTCCTELEPNIFSSSLPAEAAFLPIHAAANNLSGYLHWSWLNWDDHPLTDTRFRLFGSGDTYNYYPGNRSSVRFERLAEGIQQYEKIQILKALYKDDADKLSALNAVLETCRDFHVTGEQCADKVNRVENFLNSQEVIEK